MKSPREIKADKIDRFKGLVEQSRTMILAEYKGLTVQEMESLRRKLREVGGRLSIVKNTLARVALNDLGISDLDGDLEGQVAFVFSQRDAVVGTKAADDFAKQNERFRLISGFFDGRRISLEEVKELANLPSRAQLQARLVGTLVAPLADFVGTFQACLREFAGTLDARSKKLEDESRAAA
jgi:large subunit ribosomal protein L10